MRRLLVIATVVLGSASPALALTVRDVIELTRAGLGEEVLLALIEVDRSVYAIDTDTLKSLKTAGVPDRVIVAMVRSGREVAPPPEPPVDLAEAPSSEPQVVVIDHQHDEPQVREVMVPVPVYVPVTRPGFRHSNRIRTSETSSTFVPFQSGPPAVRPAEPKTEPVYWGFGGKLRPDAWQPEPSRHRDRRDGDRH